MIKVHKMFKESAIFIIVALMIGFVLGLYFPYYVRPSSFGEYTSDQKYKYVVTEDETRLCQVVSIMDENNNVIFHTNGYMNKGWHSGLFDHNIQWANESYDLFVEDGRSTLDVYLFTGTTWDGPYALCQDDTGAYFLIDPRYQVDLSDPMYSNLPIPYPKERASKELLEAFTYSDMKPSDYSTYIEDVDGIVLVGEIKSYDYESDEYNLFD